MIKTYYIVMYISDWKYPATLIPGAPDRPLRVCGLVSEGVHWINPNTFWKSYFPSLGEEEGMKLYNVITSIRM